MIALVEKYGTRKWSVIGAQLTGRNGKQCRERYAGVGAHLRCSSLSPCHQPTQVAQPA